MSAFFEAAEFFCAARCFKKLLTQGAAPLSYEYASEPGKAEKNDAARTVNPKSIEGLLRAAGWRLVPVPSFNHQILNWYHLDCWLVIPPDEEAPSARFKNRNDALHWAQEQAGLRLKQEAA